MHHSAFEHAGFDELNASYLRLQVAETWAAEHVPERAAAPRHVEIVDEIPLTAVGKPYKAELRRRATEQAARDAIVDTPLSDQVRAVLVGAAIEIHVAQSAHDDQVRASLSQYAWTWKLTS
jgi:fatty-acyl-CoA synthase